jgi:hypothetical protein
MYFFYWLEVNPTQLKIQIGSIFAQFFRLALRSLLSVPPRWVDQCGGGWIQVNRWPYSFTLRNQVWRVVEG